MKSVLEELQLSIVQKLKSLKMQIEILPYSQSNLDDLMDVFVHTRSGNACLVLPPIPTKVRPNTPGPIFESIKIKLRIYENKYTCSDVTSIIKQAEHISRSLHHWVPEQKKWNSCLQLNNSNPWSIIEIKNNQTCLEIDFNMEGII